jgi:adenylate cyclase
MANGLQTSRPLSALAWGLAATLAVAVAALAGLDRRAEWAALDARFALLSNAPPDDQLVHVDIDDRTLATHGRWPWPRSQTAGLVEVLQRAGAKAVVLDIEMPQGQEVRLEAPLWRLYEPGAATDLATIGRGGATPIFDDLILAEALRTGGPIVLPYHADFDQPPDTLVVLLREAMTSGPISLDQARRVAAGAFEAGALPSAPAESALNRAYLSARSLERMERLRIGSGRPRWGIEGGAAVAMPSPGLEHATATGFVSIRRDGDGVLRRTALLHADAEGHLYPQLGLAIALLAAGSDHPPELRFEPDALVLNGRPLQRRIPLDDDGRMLINWRRQGDSDGPGHVSAGAVASVYKHMQALENNHRRMRIEQALLAKMLAHRPFLNLLGEADALYTERLQTQRELLRAMLYNPDAVEEARSKLAAIQQGEARIEARLDELAPELLDEFYLQSLAEDDPRRDELTEVRSRLITQLPAAHAKLEEALSEGLELLRPFVDGKVALVGSVATGAPDFVHTPVSGELPGVEVHANVANTILSGAFVRQVGPGANLVLVLAAGALVTLVASTRPVLQAGPLAVLLAAMFVGANALAFNVLGLWVAMVAPLAAMAASFVVVTAWRQLTEERAKRQIRGMFAHALSPALVDQLISDPSVAHLGGQRRQVSTFFADLAGFTSISERLDEQQTVGLLNRYFDRMSEVIQDRWGGYVNKFLGDGLLVLFGAPVVQADHARRAVYAAAECLTQVRQLGKTLADEIPAAGRIGCRIGITTGEAMVGNCGSSSRLDYTAIGDVVNLASRLEGANKFFRTAAMVDEATWQAGGNDGLVVRRLGTIRVIGRTQPVAVREIIGKAADVEPQRVEALREFEAALELYEQRQFARAAEILAAVADSMPADGPSRVYLDLARRFASEPPGDDWQPVVELTEK